MLIVLLLGFSFYSFAQGITETITDAETGTIEFETLTGGTTTHESCCEPLTIKVTFSNLSGTQDNDLFLKIRWFPNDEIFDYTDCNICETGEIYDQGVLTNYEIIIEGTVPPPGPIGVPTEYEYTIKVPYFNTSTGSMFDLIYRNDQGNLVVAESPPFGIEPSNCPTSSTYVSDLISSEDFESATDMCNETAFMDKIRPYSDLIFDVDEYCFKGSSINYVDFNPNPGTKIIVEEGNRLEIDYGHLYSCKGKMWKGIHVEKNAELVLTNSKIKDAEFGITFEKGAKLTLENNEFLDNYVHMKAIPMEIPLGGGGTGPATTISSFKRNTFSGTGSLVNKYDGQSTNPQDYPYAGIFIGDGQDGGYTCGPLRFVTSNSTDVNEFSQLANGIINREDGGELFVKGCTFEDITSSYGTGYSTNGYGILHNKFIHPCIINGFENWPNNYSFNNVATALRTNLASIVKFKNQKVIQSERGVHSTKTLLASYINDNSFSTSWNSIEIANTYLSLGDFEIKDNDIDLDIPTTEVLDKGGIVLANVSCAGNQFFSTSLISGNSIDAAEGETGITLGDVENLVVEDNSVEIAADITDAKGLSVIGGNELVLSCNDFQGSYNGTTNTVKTTGIYFSGLNKSTISCNDIYSSHTSIHVYKMNKTHLKGNAIHTSAIGIEYGEDGEPNAQTGIQEYNGNQWFSSYSSSNGNYGALHNAPILKALNSEFIVNDNEGSTYTTTDKPDFVSEDDDRSNFSCESLSNCITELGIVAENWDRLDSVALTDSTFGEFLLRDLQWKVYSAMKDSFISWNSGFETKIQNLGMADLYQADKDLHAILGLIKLDSFPDSLISESFVDTMTVTQLNTIYDELAVGYDSMVVTLSDYITNQDYATSSSDNFINYMSDALYWESQLWDGENGYLDSFQIGMCSFVGGNAWDRMNALQPASVMSYSLDFDCVVERESKIEKPTGDFSLKVSPNPAHSELQILNFDKFSEDKSEFTIIDMNGRTVQTGMLSEKGIINLQPRIQSGLYLLLIDQYSTKFVLVR